MAPAIAGFFTGWRTMMKYEFNFKIEIEDTDEHLAWMKVAYLLKYGTDAGTPKGVTITAVQMENYDETKP
jgi:hypothetical protein